MPKGFTRKAVEGFTKFMAASMKDAGVDSSRADASTAKVRNLLDKGFPKIRN